MASSGGAPSVIRCYGPILGFLNLDGPAAEEDVRMDEATLAPLFRGPALIYKGRPWCDVLFLYCRLTADGLVEGEASSVFEIIKSCGARFAIVCAKADRTSLTAAAQSPTDWVANTAFVLDRRGRCLPDSYAELFRKMFAGVPFARAFAELAPQGPGPWHDRMPVQFVTPKIPNVAFAPDWFPNQRMPQPDEFEDLAAALLGVLQASPRRAGVVVRLFKGAESAPLDEPTLFAAVGAALGYSVHQAIALGKLVPREVSEGAKGLLMEAAGKDGRKYWFGDLPNALLFEDGPGRINAWQILRARLEAQGAPVPDLPPIVRRTSQSVGAGDFGKLDLGPGLTPSLQPLDLLRAQWPEVEALLHRFKRPPGGWPIDLACAAVRAIEAREALSPGDAARIIMEAAIPMSKLTALG